MATGSFIEMFMTTFGWHLYDIVWGVISSTGLAYLPILAAIIDNVIAPLESQEAKSAAVTSLRRLEIDIVRIIIMMLLAVSPMMTINFGAVSHTKVCQDKTFKGGSTGTVFEGILDKIVIGDQEAKVPPWFYLVMSISGGVNDAIIVSMPCELDIRQLEYEVSTVKITDPHLRRETQRFVTECYDRARADFFNNSRQMPDSMSIDDINWIGSEFFNDTYYKTHYARNPVPSFEFDPRRESDAAHVSTNSTVTPDSGYPSCSEWWNDSESGIRKRLVDEYPPKMMARLKKRFTGKPDVEAENVAVRAALDNEGPSVSEGLNVGGDISVDTSDLIGDAVGMGGALLTSALIQPVVFVVKQTAPYIQATMLMGIYFLLPWVLLVGNYEWSTIRTSTVTIFAIKFWTSIWAVVDLLDNKLGYALRAASGNIGFNAISDENIMMWAILDILILALYMGLPFFFLQMLSWGGESGASATNSTANDAAGQSKSAGSKGSSVVEGAITK